MEKDILLAKTLCVVAFGMTGIMLLSPVFPPRSGFSGTIQLIIVAGILLRIQKQYSIELITESAKKLLFYVAILYFGMTAMVTVPNLYQKSVHMQEIVAVAKACHESRNNRVIYVKPFKEISKVETVMSGFHIPNYGLTNDENQWENIAFARYYGIKGIYMDSKEKKDADIK